MGLGTTKCCKCFYRIGPESVWGIAIASFASKAAFSKWRLMADSGQS